MEINKYIDHTILKAFATSSEVKKICQEAIKYEFKSVCINPSYIELAKRELEKSEVLVCTVIGFPLGSNTKEIKILETIDAINKGADEIDMVINVGHAKEHRYEEIEDEIRCVVAASEGHCVKVIIETCYLTIEEKIEVCKAAKRANATFVKTSTGFGPGGATVEDIMLMRSTVGTEMGVKASGGIRSLEDAQQMIEAGATRIGASSGVAIMNAQVSNENY